MVFLTKAFWVSVVDPLQITWQTSFFGSIDLADIDTWASSSFPVLTDTIKITAQHGLVQRLVDELVHEISSHLGSGIADQVGTPVGFFLGGLISACAQDDGACLSTTLIV